MPLRLPSIQTVMGVDFSGAALSGKNAWMAELRVSFRRETLELVKVSRLGRLAGSDDRKQVNGSLVDRISAAKRTLFGMDFPFGLPAELPMGGWDDQLTHIRAFDGGAKDYGHFLVDQTKIVAGKKHIRRLTDQETSTPFDSYHYRIIYQTFHGMRDVLAPVADDPATAVWPFQYDKTDAKRIVVEACPSSTLKRLGLPHQNYKQSGGKPPETKHKRTRQTILKGISTLVTMTTYQRRVLMSNPGGDALDAVLAGIGSWHDARHADHSAIALHDRYPREGRVYA